MFWFGLNHDCTTRHSPLLRREIRLPNYTEMSEFFHRASFVQINWDVEHALKEPPFVLRWLAAPHLQDPWIFFDETRRKDMI
jgi:hypothetical protein